MVKLGFVTSDFTCTLEEVQDTSDLSHRADAVRIDGMRVVQQQPEATRKQRDHLLPPHRRPDLPRRIDRSPATPRRLSPSP